MATIYFRANGEAGVWWTKFYHPRTFRCLRASLGTADPHEARRMLGRLEAEIVLRKPEIAEAELPEKILDAIGPGPASPLTVTEAVHINPVSASVIDAIAAYYRHICADNDSHHAANKLSILRAFFGSATVESATCTACREVTLPYFKGKTIDGITPVLLQQFLSAKEVSDKTRKHYRQVFHHFFEKMIDFSLFVPSNPLRPNPAAALPHYEDKNEVIIFLNEDEITAQLAALESDQKIHLAVEIMIHAGLRREEVLGLRTEDISPEAKTIKVAKYIDPRTNEPRKLKTGWRDVPVVPVLRERLLKYLDGHEGFWLLPGWNDERWTADHFSKSLAGLNKNVGLTWTCNEYRHTYATHLAKSGASLFKIAKLMGNSHQIVERHYAQFVLECDD